MIIATGLELGMLAVMLSAHDTRTRVVGALLWCAYLHYSATRAAIEAFAEWWDEHNNPPGTGA